MMATMHPSRLHRLWCRVMLLPLLVSGRLWTAAAAEPADALKDSPQVKLEVFRRGRFVFQKNCLPCHGRFGEGDGELVKGWAVLPRNFRLAAFKYRSTPYGKLPTDDDLRRTIRRGISGSAMPSFTQLREEELEAVITYLKSLSPAWEDERLHARPIEVPRRPRWFDDPLPLRQNAEEGRRLFQISCAACHGSDGAGDGVAAGSLKDSADQPVAPADLRKPRRSGPGPEDACRTILTGINGTPMPGFDGALTPEQTWQVVAFLTTLQINQP
jgi:mono/diheme cytochrome c family protein